MPRPNLSSMLSTLVSLLLLLPAHQASSSPASGQREPEPESTVAAAAVGASHGHQQLAFSAPPTDRHATALTSAVARVDGSSHVPQAHSYSLVHAVHLGTHAHPGLHARHDFKPGDLSTYSAMDSASAYPFTDLVLRSVPGKVWRPSHPARSDVYEAARRRSFRSSMLRRIIGRDGDRMEQEDAHSQLSQLSALADQLEWAEVDTPVPDVTDVETLSTLAKMASNAYSTPDDGGWYDLSNSSTSASPSYNLSSSFGWEKDGIRGHVFSNGPNNDSIVIAIKGTSSFSGPGAPTGRQDKLNDNLLFSCCCARVDWTWTPVCDCYSGQPNRCNLTCLEQSLMEKSVYYPTATDLFNNITLMYPTSTIWLTGHSLGGAMAALLGVTFGIPTVTFESPGDLLPAKRLHLPLPPGANWDDRRPEFGITHVYTNSDPVPQGVCTGVLSSCNLVGFAMESKCHTGQTIVYDAVGKLGWSVDIRTHRIGVVIDKLLVPDWDKKDQMRSTFVPVTTQQSASVTSSVPRTSIADRLYRWRWPWHRRKNKGKGKEGHDGDDNDNDDDRGGDGDADGGHEGDGGAGGEAPSSHNRSHVPTPDIDSKCQDCFRWEYFDDDGTGSNQTALQEALMRRNLRAGDRKKCF